MRFRDLFVGGNKRQDRAGQRVPRAWSCSCIFLPHPCSRFLLQQSSFTHLYPLLPLSLSDSHSLGSFTYAHSAACRDPLFRGTFFFFFFFSIPVPLLPLRWVHVVGSVTFIESPCSIVYNSISWPLPRELIVTPSPTLTHSSTPHHPRPFRVATLSALFVRRGVFIAPFFFPS